MKRINRAIILAFFTLVSVTGFAADSSQSGQANNSKPKQEAVQAGHLNTLSYGECVDYMQQELHATDDEAHNRCGAIQ